MSKLQIETWSMPAAELGPENPLPPLQALQELHVVNKGPHIPPELLQNARYGHLPNILPYTMQDAYNRDRQMRDFRVAVLENEILKATFLLELGGRLWSLVHKPSGRELLEVNPIFQPANLAIRNAWFSGGVEWNIGAIGHSPFTCAPLFAARVEGPGGTPMLRLYEWERIRQVPFQIDAYLPDGSPVLLIRVRITNPHQREIPMYWWSNMAAPESSDTQVVVPADSAFQFHYRDGLRVIPTPIYDGINVTRPTELPHAIDFFYRAPADQRRWITALDAKGRGLVQTSTDLLQGRKLFAWGMNAGGRQWQAFLSEAGRAYIEIQAGLAWTQLEHLPMPAGAEWSWLEAYGLMESDPAAVHGSDWKAAQKSVANKLEQLIPRQELEAEFKRGAAFVDRPPAEILQRGSGWGALERIRRQAAGEPPFCSAGLVFDEQSLGQEQTPWLNLLRQGNLSATEPKSFMVQSEWQSLLESSREPNWLAQLHLGVMRHYAGNHAGAQQAWEQSLQQVKTPWALRNLAVLAWDEQRLDQAAELYLAACRLKPDLIPLLVECGRFLMEAERPKLWLELLGELDPAVRKVGRLRLLEAQAALELGDFETVERLFMKKVVIPDIREGERSLSHLWYDYHERRLSTAENRPIDAALRGRVRREHPVPPAFDFRMTLEDEELL